MSNKWIKPTVPETTLTNAKLTVNVLDNKEPLKFEIEGD
jgi:hypothetical protein